MSESQVRIFISYSKGDGEFISVFLERFKKHFLASEGFIIWDESMLQPGVDARQEITNQLMSADIAVLCVSADFINDNSVDTREFISLANSPEKPWIIPVYFSPCNNTVWERLSVRYSFRPDGEHYKFSGNRDEFCFCDLVHFNKEDGRLVPDNQKENYLKELLAEIKTILNPQVAEDIFNKQIASADPQHYINPAEYPYFERDSFFGREELLKEIDDRLKELDLPLLLSGIGGMGKTVVAIAYGKNKVYASGYDHIAWVNVTGELFTSLFTTFQGNTIVPFEYSRDGDRQKDIAAILQLLKLVHGNNLLILDNCNAENELQEFINAWKMHLPGWKCLITTRCELQINKRQRIALQVMGPEAAEKLFKYHNNDEDFDAASFSKIYEYAGGHAFLIELLAKFGNVNSRINSTDALLTYLQTKGIKELSKSVVAKQGQQAESDKTVSEFVLHLYNPQALELKKQEYMRYFSLLPAAEIEFARLAYLFGIPGGAEEEFDETLLSLSRSGWLISNKGNFKCHQIIKQICREKLSPDPANTAVLLQTLSSLFAARNITKAIPWLEIGFAVVNEIETATTVYASLLLNMSDMAKLSGASFYILPLLEKALRIHTSLNESGDVSVCLERFGDYYLQRGNREEALNYYSRYNSVVENMLSKSPADPALQHLYIISLFKMGEVFQEDNQLTVAIRYFEEVKLRSGMLVQKYPAEIMYKNNLAGSLSRIGEIYQAENNSKQAMKAYLEFNKIEEELVRQSPQNNEYRNNLSISYCQLGDLYREGNDTAEALNWYKKYNNAKKQLADSDPDNVVYQNGLAITYARLSLVSYGAEKKNYLSEAKKIWDGLAEKVPDNISYKSNQAWVNNELNVLAQ